MAEDHAWKYLAEQPIRIPGSPFWNVLSRFGRDELLALVLSVVATAIFGFFAVPLWFLTIVGPIAEKLGFFPLHIKAAFDEYKTTHKKLRKSLKYYVRREMKESFRSLTEDVLFHDPLYILFMALGLWMLSGTPVWIISFLSFILALLLVAIGEVAYTELRYKAFKRRFKKAGFQIESFYETRFLISAKVPPKKVVQNMKKAFDLTNDRKLTYSDVYFVNKLTPYSDRAARIRLRKRTSPDGKSFFQTAQIVYTRARETTLSPFEQHRFFPILKEKITAVIEGKMPSDFKEIKSKKVKSMFNGIVASNIGHKVKFSRFVVNDEELMVSADEMKAKDDAYILEIKVYSDLKLLMQAMRYIMQQFPVLQTTHMKSELLETVS